MVNLFPSKVRTSPGANGSEEIGAIKHRNNGTLFYNIILNSAGRQRQPVGTFSGRQVGLLFLADQETVLFELALTGGWKRQ
ncbi:hypothetical protein Pan161_47890 [Gimesia algae]|uniref:Uncharacterized protein n=1 Tax=Gimesia algae TaxID=2527971 RepID=A0A517VJD2_9PLAN|nr:hypothetical protein Pan161_47890 [Gimesia algae]